MLIILLFSSFSYSEINSNDCSFSFATLREGSDLDDLLKIVKPNKVLPSWMKVEKSCLDKFPEIGSVIQESLETGKKCLLNLHIQSKLENSGAKLNLEALEKYSTDNPLNFICNEDTHRWTAYDSNAYASTTKATLNHPFISINPSYSSLKPLPDGKTYFGNKELKVTIFHEMLHNLGFKHSEDIEYSYGCASCCFAGTSAIEREAGCKLCTGNYSSASDPVYLKDLIDWVRSLGVISSRQWMAYDSVKLALATNPNRETALQMVRISGTINRIIGGSLSDEFKARYSPVTFEEEITLKLSSCRHPECKDPAVVKKVDTITKGNSLIWLDRNYEKAYDYYMLLDASILSGDELSSLNSNLSKMLKSDLWEVYDYYQKNPRGNKDIKIFSLIQKLEELGSKKSAK